MTDVIDGLLDQIGQLPLWAVLLTVGLVMALETTMLVGIVVPGDVVVLFAAATADGPVELGLLVLAVTVGSLTGETVGFGLGRRWGGRLRSSRAGRRLGEQRWARAADFLHRRGGHAVFLARYLAAVHAVTPIVAGTVGMRYRRFIAWCAAGGLSWSALYVTLGGAAGASYREYAGNLGTATSVALGGLAGAGVCAGMAWLRHRALLQTRLVALVAGGAMTGGGLVAWWLVGADDVVGVETALVAVLLLAVAVFGDALRARRSAGDQQSAPRPLPLPGPEPELELEPIGGGQVRAG